MAFTHCKKLIVFLTMIIAIGVTTCRYGAKLHICPRTFMSVCYLKTQNGGNRLVKRWRTKSLHRIIAVIKHESIFCIRRFTVQLKYADRQLSSHFSTKLNSALFRPTFFYVDWEFGNSLKFCQQLKCNVIATCFASLSVMRVVDSLANENSTLAIAIGELNPVYCWSLVAKSFLVTKKQSLI